MRAAKGEAEVMRLKVAGEAAEAAKVEAARAEAEEARMVAVEEQASRLEATVKAAMQAWDAAITAMVELRAPGIVAEAVLTAMQMTAMTRVLKLQRQLRQ